MKCVMYLFLRFGAVNEPLKHEVCNGVEAHGENVWHEVVLKQCAVHVLRGNAHQLLHHVRPHLVNQQLGQAAYARQTKQNVNHDHRKIILLGRVILHLRD